MGLNKMTYIVAYEFLSNAWHITVVQQLFVSIPHVSRFQSESGVQDCHPSEFLPMLETVATCKISVTMCLMFVASASDEDIDSTILNLPFAV